MLAKSVIPHPVIPLSPTMQYTEGFLWTNIKALYIFWTIDSETFFQLNYSSCSADIIFELKVNKPFAFRPESKNWLIKGYRF